MLLLNSTLRIVKIIGSLGILFSNVDINREKNVDIVREIRDVVCIIMSVFWI